MSHGIIGGFVGMIVYLLIEYLLNWHISPREKKNWLELI